MLFRSGTYRHATYRDRSGKGGFVQCGGITVEQPVRLWRGCDQHRTACPQWTGKCPVDVGFIGPRTGQQHGGDTAQIDNHLPIVPGGWVCPKFGGFIRVASGNQEVYGDRWHGGTLI